MARRFVPLLLLSTAFACGGGSNAAAPTLVPHNRVTTTGVVTGFQAHSTGCVEFENAKAGEVSAYVTPDTLLVALVAGSCAAPGNVIVEKPGNVTADAPLGTNHIRLTNPTDDAVTYTISLTHWY